MFIKQSDFIGKSAFLKAMAGVRIPHGGVLDAEITFGSMGFRNLLRSKQCAFSVISQTHYEQLTVFEALQFVATLCNTAR